MSESVSLNVTGMKCGGCESNVKAKLGGMDGIQSMNVSHKVDTVEVEFDTDKTSVEEIKKAIIDAGYVVEEAE